MIKFDSQRSPIFATNGMACSSQALATCVGRDILRSGGNAADAAIAMAAMLNVTEPMMNGLGGDTFIMIYWNGQLYGINGSGRSSATITNTWIQALGSRMPKAGGPTVTVPGALDGYLAMHERFGSRPLAELLEPAISYARNGFPVGEKISQAWSWGSSKLKKYSPDSRDFFNRSGEAPKAGEIFFLPHLAETWEQISKRGRNAIYTGDIAERIVATVLANGGCMSLDDLSANRAEWVDPLRINWRDKILCEMPPNGQGLIVPMVLKMVDTLDVSDLLKSDPAIGDHILIEAIKLAFREAESHVADPSFGSVPIQDLLDDRYLSQLAAEINLGAASPVQVPGRVFGDTTYFTVADTNGNAISIITSISDVFGSGLVVPDTGIILHNRGADFVLSPSHPNRLEASKRVRHTILPAMVLNSEGRLDLSFGCMGANMQPQGQAQILLRYYEQGMNLQEALDAPRVRMLDGVRISVEKHHDPVFVQSLMRLGHQIVSFEAAPTCWREAHDFMPTFEGSAQAIALTDNNGRVFCGASDPRLDGIAAGY